MQNRQFTHPQKHYKDEIMVTPLCVCVCVCVCVRVRAACRPIYWGDAILLVYNRE